MMKRIYSQVTVGMFSLLLFFSACRDGKQEPINNSEGKQISRLTLPGFADSKVRTLGVKGETFFVKVHSTRPWSLAISPAESSTWLQIVGKDRDLSADNLGVEIRVSANTGGERKAKLVLHSGVEVFDELTIIQQSGQDPNLPKPPGGATPPPTPPQAGGGDKPLIPMGEHIYGTTTLLEVPRLMGGSNMYFVTFRTSDGKPNYSVEYDVNKRHARWVAYSWTPETASKSFSGRSETWAWDPIIPRQYNTDYMFKGSGFSRGHLVASNDRKYSQEANEQTFYYCNVSPQRQKHNAGVWLRLEELLQEWARSSGRLDYDTLYVAKGGTIADDQIEAERVYDLIVVPKYYWMAVLMKKGNTYHSIAFWTEHQKPDYPGNYRSLTRTVDEIEALTGIDLFHNLDDAIEQSVEAQGADAFPWPRI